MVSEHQDLKLSGQSRARLRKKQEKNQKTTLMQCVEISI